MTEGAFRAKEWREQVTARGQCHGPRCRRAASGYLCERCKRKLSGIAASMSMRQRVTRKFLHDWECLMRGVCIECERPSTKRLCKACKRTKYPYATRDLVRPLIRYSAIPSRN